MSEIDDNVLKNIILDNGDKSALNIISRLRFISTIGPNQKVDVASLSVMENNFITNKIYRSIVNTESRYTTYNFISETINDALNLINMCLKKNSKTYLEVGKQILNELKNIRTGLSNLSGTYKSGMKFCNDIMALQTLSNIKIRNLETKFSSLNNNEEEVVEVPF